MSLSLFSGLSTPKADLLAFYSVTTFTTTPLALAFYPKQYKLESERRHRERDASASKRSSSSDDSSDEGKTSTGDIRSRFMVVLEQFDHLPAVFTFCKLLQAPPQYQSSISDVKDKKIDEKEDVKGKSVEQSSEATKSPISISTLRLIELTDRTSAVMKASGVPSSLLASDTLSNIFRTFSLGTLGIPTTSSLSITPGETYASAVAEHAQSERSEVLVLPWALKEAQQEKQQELEHAGYLGQVHNPFAGLFGVGGKSGGSKEGSPMYASFVRKVFAEGEFEVVDDAASYH